MSNRQHLRISSIILVLVATLAGARVHALGLELEGRFWIPDLEGSARYADLDLEVDPLEQLGLDSSEVPELRGTFRPGLGIFLRAGWAQFSTDGELSLGLDDLPLPIDASLRSDLDFDYARLGAGWQFVSPNKTLRIGPFVEAKAVSGDASARLDSPFIGDSVKESFEGAFGSAGGLVEIQPHDKLQIFAEYSVLVGDDTVDFNDGEVGLRFYPIYWLGVGAGYRMIEIDGEIDNIDLGLDFDGFFVTAVVRF